MDKEKTAVIFRKFSDGEIIALFPELLGDLDTSTCLSYMHIGQHSSADEYFLIQKTELAKPEEYKDLFNELTSIGYNLKVYQRDSQKFDRIREESLKELK